MMNEEFDKIDSDFKKCLSFEDSTAKIKRINELIEDTNSSSLPLIVKKRLIGRMAEQQVSLIASLDFGADADI